MHTHNTFTKHITHRLFILLMVALLTISLNLTITSASTKPTLNITNQTLYIGDTLTLKVTNTHQKIRWSTSNKQIATVTTDGKVKAHSKGKVTITAKINTKRLKCSLTVKEFNSLEAVKRISYKLYETPDGIIAILKNNTTTNLSLEATLNYYSNKNLQCISVNSNPVFEKGKTSTIFFMTPYDKNFYKVPYDSYKLTLEVTQTHNTVSKVNNIKINSHLGYFGEAHAEVTNTSNIKLNTIQLSVIYYDKNNKPIGYSSLYADCKQPNSTDTVVFNPVNDEEYDTPRTTNYKIFVNNAYTSTEK